MKMRNWLIKIRKNKGLTQEDVASAAFIDRAYYTQIENGNRNPSLHVAKNIADTLNFSSSIFFMEHCEAFHLALTNSPIIIAHCDLELRYTWIYNSLNFPSEQVIGLRDDELTMNEGIVEFMTLKSTVLKEKKPLRKIVTFPFKKGVRTFDVFAQPLRNPNGNIIGISTSATDLTDYLKKNILYLKEQDHEGGFFELYTK
ncbi:helix-turn-helix domain-containing protein [Bacillus tianshenii]|nr:helix-turn-helix domain-containing protein [Bacillus tianshenii]